MIRIIKNKKEMTYDAPDISITLSAPHNGKCFGLVTLRNDVWKVMESDYVEMMYDDQTKRLYMFGSDRQNGYRMYLRSKNPNQSKNRYMRVGQKSFVDMVRNLIGDYNIQYDDKLKLHYVQA